MLCRIIVKQLDIDLVTNYIFCHVIIKMMCNTISEYDLPNNSSESFPIMEISLSTLEVRVCSTKGLWCVSASIASIGIVILQGGYTNKRYVIYEF